MVAEEDLKVDRVANVVRDTKLRVETEELLRKVSRDRLGVRLLPNIFETPTSAAGRTPSLQI